MIVRDVRVRSARISVNNFINNFTTGNAYAGDELPELGIDGEDVPDIPCGHRKSNVPAFEFRHAGSTRVVIRDGEPESWTNFPLWT